MRDLSQIHRLPVLAGDGVVLRPWRLRDAAGVASLCDDESVSRWMPLMPHPYTLADGEVWVGDAARKWREERWANFAAEDPVTRSLVGSCGLRIDREKESGEIGYLVHRDRRRQGIAAACVALLTDWAFDDLGLGRLQIRADTRNVASRRTIAACGYRFEGVLRGADVVGGERVDDVLHALAPDDPRPWRARLGRGCRRRALAARPRLAAAHRRPRGGPALRAGRRRGRPGGLRRPRRGALDPPRAGPVHAWPTAEQFIADATTSPPARRARPARGRRRRDRRAPRQRQPRPLRRPAGGGDRLLGEASRRAARALPWRRRASSSTGRSPRSASSASSCSPTPATRRRRRWPAGSASRASACCAASSRRRRARAAWGGSCRPRTAASRPATTRCSSRACARTPPRTPESARKRAAEPCGTGGSFGPLTRTPLSDPANRLDVR